MASASTPPPMCQLCTHALSSVYCAECSLYLCTELGCDAELHRAAATSKHVRTPTQQQGSAAAASSSSTAAQSALSTPVAPGGPGAPLCDLCEDLPSVVSCPDCKLSFCKECDLDMHSPPNKKTHVRVPIDSGNTTAAASPSPAATATPAAAAVPPKPSTAPAGASKPAAPAEPCAVCDENDSTLSCAECDMDLCQSCSTDLHKPAKMSNHKITPYGASAADPVKPSTAPSQPSKPATTLNPPTPSSAAATTKPNTPSSSAAAAAPLCEICEEEPAALACPECKSRFCAGCDADIHKPAKMAGHKRNPLSNLSRPSTASPAAPQEAAASKPVLAASPSPPPPAAAAGELCAMCDENPPEVHCAECKMDLCIKGGCDTDMHLSGKTMQHKRGKIGEKSAGPVSSTPTPQPQAPTVAAGAAAALLKPQAVAAAAAPAGSVADCEVCEAKPGPISCDACAMSNLCDDCDRDLHKPAKMQSHQRKRAGGQQGTAASPPPAAAAPAAAASSAAIQECEVCEAKPGPISCDACDMSNLCEDCDRDLHKPVKMQAHQRTRKDGKAIESAKPSPTPSPPPAAATPKPSTPPAQAPPAAAAAGGKTEPCEVCEEVDSTFHCADCGMDLCGGCNTDLHKPAKMQSHKVTPIGGGPAVAAPLASTPAPSQPHPSAAAAAGASTTECQVCEDAPATINCQDCNFALCSDCNRDLHKPAKMASHRRSPLGAAKPSTPVTPAAAAAAPAAASAAAVGQVAKASSATCVMCDEQPSEVHCPECKMDLCIKGGCDADMHRSGKTATHKRYKFGEVMSGAPPTQAAAAAPKPVTPAANGALNALKATPNPPAATPAAAAAAVECEVCEEHPAEVRCPDCKMNICIKGGCDNDLHKSGTKNAAHKRAPINGASTPALPSTRAASPSPPPAVAVASAGPAPTCEVCDENVSEVHCVECKMDLCIKGGCDTDLHKPGSKNASHHRNKYGAAAAASSSAPTPSPTSTAASPAAIQDCEVCEAKPGPISCDACDMSNLCEDCDRDLHKPVKMQAHQRTRKDGKAIESARPSPTPSPPPKPATPAVVSKSPSPPPPVVAAPEGDEGGLCAMCDENPAEVQCAQCKMKLCLVGGCDADMHRMAKNAGHKRTKIAASSPKEGGIGGIASPRSFPQGQKCELCDEAEPVAFCEECKMYLCKSNGCDDDVHKPEKMKNHHRVAIFGAAPAGTPTDAAAADVQQQPQSAPPATPVKVEPPHVVEDEAKESPMSPSSMNNTGPFTVQLSTPSGSKIVVAGAGSGTAVPPSPAKSPAIAEEKKENNQQSKTPEAKPKSAAEEKKSPTSPKNAPKSPKSPKAAISAAADKKQPSPKVAPRSITSEPLVPIGSTATSSNVLPGDAAELRKMVEELQKRLAQVEAEVQSPKSAGDQRRRHKSKSREHRSKKRHASSQPREQADASVDQPESKAAEHKSEPKSHLEVPDAEPKEQEAADDKQRERSPRKHRSRKHRSSRSPRKQQREATPEKPVIPAPITPPQGPLSPPQRRLAQLEELIEHQLAAREEEEEALEQARIEEEKAERTARHDRREARRRKRRERQEREAAQALERVRAREHRAEEEESRRFNQAREKKHEREEEKDYPSPYSPRKSPRREQHRARQERDGDFDEQADQRGAGEEDESRALDKFEDADEPSLVAELFGGPAKQHQRASDRESSSARRMEADLARRGEVASVGGAASSSRSRAARIRDRLLAASQLSDAATSATLNNHHAARPAPPAEQLPPEFSHFSADYPGSSRVKPDVHIHDLPSHDARSHSAELIARFRREARLELEGRRNAQLSHIWAAGQASVDAHTGYNQMLFHPPPIPPPMFDFTAVNPHEFANSFAAMRGMNSESSSNSTSRDVSPSHGRSKHIYSFMPIGGNGGANNGLSASQPLSSAHVVLDHNNPFAAGRPHTSHGSVPQPMPPARTQPASRPMSARGDGASTSRRRAQLAATARPAHTGHFSTSTAASNAHRSPSPPVSSRHRAAPPVPARTFYRPDVKEGPTPSERIVSEIVNHPNAAVWRQSNLRTIFGLQQVKKIQNVAKDTMDDKSNPYLR